MLPVSLDCLFLITPSSCVPYVTSFSGLSVSDYPFVLWTICCQFLSIVSFVLPLRLVYPILPVSLDCQFCLPLRLVARFSGLSVFDYLFVLCSLCYQILWVIKNGQSRETGNIGYTRRRGNQKRTIQRNW
jgi:hypothetical protein